MGQKLSLLPLTSGFKVNSFGRLRPTKPLRRASGLDMWSWPTTFKQFSAASKHFYPDNAAHSLHASYGDGVIIRRRWRYDAFRSCSHFVMEGVSFLLWTNSRPHMDNNCQIAARSVSDAAKVPFASPTHGCIHSYHPLFSRWRRAQGNTSALLLCCWTPMWLGQPFVRVASILLFSCVLHMRT